MVWSPFSSTRVMSVCLPGERGRRPPSLVTPVAFLRVCVSPGAGQRAKQSRAFHKPSGIPQPQESSALLI